MTLLKKGEQSDCYNYRGITLLSIAEEILTRVLLMRLLTTIAVENILQNLRGFRANRGTTVAVFVLGNLQEKCRKQNNGLHVTFIDFPKALDTANSSGLWCIPKNWAAPKLSVNYHSA